MKNCQVNPLSQSENRIVYSKSICLCAAPKDILFHRSYSYAVALALKGRCVVQLSPFSRAGCALDSSYGLQCLPLFLSTTNLSPTRYDVISFNFGMHDVDYSGHFPEVKSFASILPSFISVCCIWFRTCVLPVSKTRVLPVLDLKCVQRRTSLASW